MEIRENKRLSWNGVWAFLMVLMSMPIGHAVMILCEHYLGNGTPLFIAAFIIGFVGILVTIWGYLLENKTAQTFLGFFGGLLFWTGWIEFVYVYIAQRYQVLPLMENGEVVTKPEYLIMPSSIGFWAMIMLYYILNSRTGCNFFNWIQKRILKKSQRRVLNSSNHNLAISTFMELNIILWTFYLLLLFVYDKNFIGDRHPIAYIVAFGSLVWALYLFYKLLHIHNIGAAVRYAIPTVTILWNFVEILGRWNVVKEIWVHPLDYVLEMSLIALSFFLFLGILFYTERRNRRNKE